MQYLHLSFQIVTGLKIFGDGSKLLELKYTFLQNSS